MKNDINILLLSVGTRNKIVQYFKKELSGKGKVYATDSSVLAPALYEADEYFIVPKITEENYINVLLNICKKNKISAVLSLIDPELSLISKNKELFLKIGVVPIISGIESIELAFNKYQMNQYLDAKGFKSIPSYLSKEIFLSDVKKGNISYPVFVKPVDGSASINISKVEEENELHYFFEKHDNLMIQKYMDGIEYGVDAYIDMHSKELVSVFIKEKIKMRAGETDKSVSIIDKEILNLVKEFTSKTNFYGVIDIDIFKVDGEYYISEINPRFGGGYPHAYECNINIPQMIISNILGKVNPKQFFDYEADTYLMKYNEVKLLQLETE